MGLWGDDKDKNAQVSEAVAAGIEKAMGPVMERLTAMAAESLNAALEAQKNSAKEMSDAFLAGLKGETDNVYKELLSALSENAKTQGELLAKIKEETDELKEVAKLQAEAAADAKEAKEGLVAAAREMKTSAESAFAGIKDALGTISAVYERSSDTLTELVSKEDKIVAEQKEVFANAAKDILAAQEKWTESFTKCENELARDYTGLFESLNRTIQSVESYSQALAESSESLKNASEQTLTALKESSQAANAAFTESTQKNTEALANTIKASNDTLTESIKASNAALTESVKATKDALTETVSTLTESLKSENASYKASLDAGIKETFKVFDEESAKLAETLSKTGQEIADAAANIPKALRG
ncbi:MAG: hypothetical protein IKS09_01780, partial [Lachnospiraceae bacterium]|nr:hypothetical protein [Lachnospiraceae bacterium]